MEKYAVYTMDCLESFSKKEEKKEPGLLVKSVKKKNKDSASQPVYLFA